MPPPPLLRVDVVRIWADAAMRADADDAVISETGTTSLNIQSYGGVSLLFT